jgi:hypothetical protein
MMTICKVTEGKGSCLLQAVCQLLNWDAPQSTSSSRQAEGSSLGGGAQPAAAHRSGSAKGGSSGNSRRQQQGTFGPVVSTLAAGEAAGADEVRATANHTFLYPPCLNTLQAQPVASRSATHT